MSTIFSNVESGSYGHLSNSTPQPFEVHENNSPDFLGGMMDLPAAGGTARDIQPTSNELPINNLASGAGLPDMVPVPTGYPPSLPPPYIVEHLIDVFFSSVPLGNKILHRSAFLDRLTAPPNTLKYPATALLHAICAVASYVSPLVEVPKLPDLSTLIVYEAFVPQSVLEEEHSFVSGGSIAFSLEQAMLARATIETDVRTRRHRKFGTTTGLLILCWYYYDNGQWADLWIQASILMRINVALGLNCSGHYTSDANPLAIERNDDAEDPAGQERLRNLFWASYVLDRQQHLATGCAPAINDEDISQELPARMVDYDAGIDVPGPRQHLSDPDLFMNHPPHLTDSWVLYVKSLVLLGRVCTFNRRLELHRRADVNNGVRPPGQMFFPRNLLYDEGGVARLDYGTFRNAESSAAILASAQFKTLDNMVIAFQGSVPSQFRDPFASNARWKRRSSGERDDDVDVNAYMVELGINAATIVLHGPHVDMGAEVCVSRDRALHAARSILDGVRAMASTSFNVLLLPRAVLSMWECAIGVLALFYYHALNNSEDEDAAMYRSEIEVFASIIGIMGEKIPLAFKTRKGLMTALDNIVTCAQEVCRSNV